MSDTLALPPLTSCDREIIHAPGSIQPHGMMLVAEQDGLCVLHVAGDIERRLGLTEWVGRKLSALIGDALSLEVHALIGSDAASGYVGQLTTSTGETLDVSVQLSKPYVIIELETVSSKGLPASRVTDRLAAVAAGFERASSLTALCNRAAVEFRRQDCK